jgi:DNA-binding NarL/FixJ family response regulator
MSGEAVRVLIADADARVRAALRSFLSTAPGFDIVAEAGTAAAALELARAHAPAAAVVSVQPPGEAESLALLRTLTGELDIPAVAISTRGGLRTRALAAGACQFVEKDGSADLLLAALHAAARR